MNFSPVRKSKRQCAKCEGDLHHSNKSGYCRRRLAHLPPERVRRYWENVEAVHAD